MAAPAPHIITEKEVKCAIQGALKAAPKGARIVGYRARIANGGIEVDVTLSADSVHAYGAFNRAFSIANSFSFDGTP